MPTTAARSKDYKRKLGFRAEVVEHRRGRFRHDLFDFGDVMAFGNRKIIIIQAYLKSAMKLHQHLTPEGNSFVEEWVNNGGIFEHHIWSYTAKKGRKKWDVKRIIFMNCKDERNINENVNVNVK